MIKERRHTRVTPVIDDLYEVIKFDDCLVIGTPSNAKEFMEQLSMPKPIKAQVQHLAFVHKSELRKKAYELIGINWQRLVDLGIVTDLRVYKTKK